jgi:hypothetical protein
MEEVMSILQAKEDETAAASSSTRRSKRCRRYVNCDREADHFRLWHDYFDDDCVYPILLHRSHRMQMTLFLNIMHKLSETSLYIYKMYDTTDRADLTAL